MLDFWNKIVYELDCYQKVFVAVVVKHRPGSPGTTRAQLLYTEAGEVMGTIGGGIMEARLLKDARSAIDEGPHDPELKTFVHRKGETDLESGLICGGSQTVVTLVVNPDHRSVLYEVVRRLRYDEPGRLVFLASGMRLEEEDILEPTYSLEGQGDDWQASVGLFNRRRILIVGCGHCGSALAKQMQILGFHVTVVEPRTGMSATATLPSRVQLQNKPYADAASGVVDARLTFAVVMTPSFSEDVDALACLLPEAFPFIGVMGSPSKLQKIKEELYTRGFSESDWERVTAPVGLAINSDTPEEIAVSVAAQILQLSN